MYSNRQRRASSETIELRKDGGLWLKSLREAKGLSQRNLSELIGTDYYTFISQLETGRGRIPPDRYVAWANALDLDPKEFVKNLMRFYDPITYNILFGNRSDASSR
jgi:transcriptional regulator with XRE-family HTH domain